MGVARVLFKRLLEGDIDKLNREGAIATTGGGAMDLRFGPWDDFAPVVARMLPTTVARTTRRKDPITNRFDPHTSQVHIGAMRSPDAPNLEPEQFEFWPPSGARAFEGRVGTAGKLRPFQPDNLPQARPGEIFALIWDDQNGVWGAFVTEAQLRNTSAPWNAVLRKTILDALDAAQEWEAAKPGAKLRNVRGFVDFQQGIQFANVQSVS